MGHLSQALHNGLFLCGLGAELGRRRDHGRYLGARETETPSRGYSCGRSCRWNSLSPSGAYHDKSVGRLGAEHLLERGYQQFAFVGYPTHGRSHDVTDFVGH
jgi:hypothetical protein